MIQQRITRVGLACLLAFVAAASLLITACGDDSEDDAKTQACDAVSDIQKQVQQLQSYTVATVTSDKVNANIDAIESDVSEIKSALPDVSSDLKSQLQSATDAFTSTLTNVASTVGESTSLQAAATQVTTAADQLAAAYRQAFASVSC
jgi:hypothetical protein